MPNQLPQRRRPWQTHLAANLRQARSIAIVGIGSDLRGDDSAGLLVIRELRAAFAGARPAAIRLFAGGTAPENLTGTIRRFRPSHIILLDAADLGLKPGAARLIALPDIGGLSFGTHALPLNIMADYLVNSLACHISVIGIQPGPLAFALAPSRPVQQAARRIAQAIQRITKASLPRPRSATRKQIKRRRA